MTKTELFEEAEKIYPICAHYSLYRCSADYSPAVEFSDGKQYRILRSYSTIVAVYCVPTNYIIVRDFYSHTTVQHIYKFRKFLSTIDGQIGMLFLYRRKDRIIVKYCTNRLKDETPDAYLFDKYEREDFSKLIAIFTED